VDRAARPYVAPPGTPAEVMNILREALAKIAEDPEAREEAKKLSMDLQFVSPAECAKVLDYLFGQPEDIVKEFRRFITF
jgi:tripartite-type tricarboxylate transporter receptor subunit TctC